MEAVKPTEVTALHEENEWGIECVQGDEEVQSTSTSQQQTASTVEGLKFAYDVPQGREEDNIIDAKPSKPIDLSQLRNQLKGL